MIDAPDRKEPRFPADKETAAAAAIANTYCGYWCRPRGTLRFAARRVVTVLLFAEACLAHGMQLEVYIPFDELTFLVNSVDFAHPN